MSGISDIDFGSVVGEVSKDNAEIDETSEDTGAKTANGCRRYLSDVDGTDHRSLSNTEPGNEAAGVDSVKVTTVSHEDGDAQNPQDAQLPSSPDPPNTIANQKSTIFKNAR